MAAKALIILQKRGRGKLASTRLERTVALSLNPWYNLNLGQALFVARVREVELDLPFALQFKTVT